MEKIPKGLYCYTTDDYGRMIVCPYWRVRKDVDNKEVGSQNYGYCLYLKKGDLELNNEIQWADAKGNHFTGNELGLPLSLLWDMVKECYINQDDEEEYEKFESNISKK